MGNSSHKQAVPDGSIGGGYDENITSNWDSLEFGSLACGPGSYYLNDETITEMHQDITTLKQAVDFINDDNLKNQDNPIVMWQLTNPWSAGIKKDSQPQYLCFHRRKFLRQNLDADSKKCLGDGFAKSVSGFQNNMRWGSPMFFKAKEKGDEIENEIVESYIKAGSAVSVANVDDGGVYKSIINSNWDSLEFGSLACGPGSYYLNDKTITEMYQDITTLEQAVDFINADNLKNQDNPIVMWQLTNPWSEGIKKDSQPQYLCFHRRKFLRQNLDADSKKCLGDGFAKSVSGFQNNMRWGSPMFFKAKEDGIKKIPPIAIIKSDHTTYEAMSVVTEQGDISPLQTELMQAEAVCVSNEDENNYTDGEEYVVVAAVVVVE